MLQGQGHCQSISHVTFLVGNAKLSAQYYCTNFGFHPFMYRGLENGYRTTACHAIKLNSIILVFISPLMSNDETKDINHHLILHGDAVKDVAFNVDNIDLIIDHIKLRGGNILQQWSESDEKGSVRMITVKTTYGDVTHTLIQRNNYPEDRFLPKWIMSPLKFIQNPYTLWSKLPSVDLQFIDHVAINQEESMIGQISEWYEHTLRFKRFWSVDDDRINTGQSGLRSTFMTNVNDKITLGFSEPGTGLKKSQIQEYLDYNNGPGVQHIAFHTNDICNTVEILKQRGVEFMHTPDTYYKLLSKRLESSSVNVTEDLRILHKLKILLDFDENGYLLQIFTKPMQDRPTLFLEIIQRNNFNGFGAGNIKALFQAVEADQQIRGNL